MYQLTALASASSVESLFWVDVPDLPSSLPLRQLGVLLYL